MRNFLILDRFINLLRRKPFNVSSAVRNYSLCCYNTNRKTTHNWKNDNILLLNELPIYKLDTLLSRNIFISKINYAKSQDRGGKEKKKPKLIKDPSKIDLRELSQLYDVENLTTQMTQAVERMKMDFVKNLTVRSTTGALEQLPVKVDGKDYQLLQLAQISRKPKLIVLNVAAFPTAIPAILKAIEKSGLNINPQQDGTTLFLPIPKVTKEHRETLSKNAKAIFITHRDEIKDIRNKAVRTVKNKKDVSEDTIRRVQSQIEVLCTKYLKEAETILNTKQDELLGSSD